MKTPKIRSLYQYLMLYGAYPHAPAARGPRATMPNEENFPFWREHTRQALELRYPVILPCPGIERHFAHAHHPEHSEDVQIAYYASETDLRNDRRTFTTPGRYLTKHCDEHLDPKAIAHFATEFRGRYGRNILGFAKTPDEIVNVFLHGPESCMSKETDEFSVRPYHPAAFYGNGITEVAYLTNRNSIVARCVVIPATKVYNTVYGDQAIVPKLTALGYQPGDLTGHQFPVSIFARESDYDTRRKLIVPFIDKSDYAHYSPQANSIRFVKGSGHILHGDEIRGNTRNTNGCLAISMPAKSVAATKPETVRTVTGVQVRITDALEVFRLETEDNIFFDPRIEEIDPTVGDELMITAGDIRRGTTTPTLFLSTPRSIDRAAVHDLSPLRTAANLRNIALHSLNPAMRNLANQLLTTQASNP